MTSRFVKLLRSKFVQDTLTLQAGKIGTTILSVISLAVTVRLMGIERYGVWKLALAFFAVWQALELSGVSLSTLTRLSIAGGRRDASDILDVMAFYIKVILTWVALSTIVMFVFAPTLARQLYNGDPRIGELAAFFSLTIAADVLYTLIVVTLQSRRLMREYAVLQNANQVVLFLCVVVAMLIRATPESMVAARLVYSYSTMLMAFVVYERLRNRGDMPYPSLVTLFRRAVSVPVVPYWRSGVAMALDKNVGNLYTQIPVTLVGILSGERAAGYLGTAIDFISRSSLLTGPIMDNMQAVVPQSVGRGDYAGLRRNFGRVLAGMVIMGVGFYGVLALTTPYVVPLLLGQESIEATPTIMMLTVMGAITAVGGIFGPLYRAFSMTRTALIIKLIAAAVMLPVGVWLIGMFGALGGAWMINGLYLISVWLTAIVTLPELGRLAGNATLTPNPSPFKGEGDLPG